MHVTWRRNVKQRKARRKREPLQVFNGPVGDPEPSRPCHRTRNGQWHYDRRRRNRSTEGPAREAA